MRVCLLSTTADPIQQAVEHHPSQAQLQKASRTFTFTPVGLNPFCKSFSNGFYFARSSLFGLVSFWAFANLQDYKLDFSKKCKRKKFHVLFKESIFWVLVSCQYQKMWTPSKKRSIFWNYINGAKVMRKKMMSKVMKTMKTCKKKILLSPPLPSPQASHNKNKTES